MKCTNRLLSYILCVATLFLTGCSNKDVLLNEYNTYSYNNSYTNTDTISVNADYFAKDLCVTNEINFGTESTYSEVAKGAGVFNVSTGEVLYNQDIFKQLYPASTTKILTAYVIIKDCNLTDNVTISASAVDQADDSQTCGFKDGDNVMVKDLLYGLMLHSGNDAAEALAEYHSGSIEEFAKVMTEEAHKLGATNSQFKNPSGLPDKEHYTSVYDMYLIFNEAIKNDTFVEIINAASHRVTYTNANGGTADKTFTNHSRYRLGTVETPNGFEIIGGKTGTTYDAGYCLVLYSKNSAGQDIISIVFKADGPHNLYLLMNQILSNFAN